MTSNMASGCFKLSCVDSKSVFASTCLIAMELKIPINFECYAYSDGALREVIRANYFHHRLMILGVMETGFRI